MRAASIVPLPTYRILKFGGSSVGRHLPRVLDILCEEQAQGPVAAVVSAFGDSTDWLLAALERAESGDAAVTAAMLERVADIAREATSGLAPDPEPVIRALLDPVADTLQGVRLTREASPQVRDRVLAAGELLSASLVAQALEARGLPALFADARSFLVTDATFGAARADIEATRSRLLAQARSWGQALPVIPGFLGATADGRTTTLGRNGSDYSAAVVAAALQATDVTVWTDVSGLMTADPLLVPDAYPVERITHHEALELAVVGVRMFHPRTMVPLAEAGIPLTIKNTIEPWAAGTRIDRAGADAGDRPTCVASRSGLSLLDVAARRVQPRLRLGERVLMALREADVPVWLTTQSALATSIAIAVDSSEAGRAVAALEAELSRELDRAEVEPVRVRRPVALVSLVAEAMGQRPNVAGRFFAALGGIGINVRAIAQGASERSIAAVVDEADVADAVRITHASFNFAQQRVSVALVGHGTVGGPFLSQLAFQKNWLVGEHGADVRLVALADSQATVFDPSGLDPATAEALLRDRPGPAGLVPLLERLQRLPVPVLVDCTAADGMEQVYQEAFRRGIHVVAANKKPLALPWPERERLLAGARAQHRAYHYETTVAASLPVIETLKNLVRTGDKVRRIEASLSGTLGFLANELMAGTPLATAVHRARELGYTEPHPREDLTGVDAARKALILARELGLALSLPDVELEPFVPVELLGEADLQAFFRALQAHEPLTAERARAIRAEGKVLRYLAVIDPAAVPAVRVGPVAVGPSHPAHDLRGSEAFVAFTTDRHRDWPLTVRGAGAGGAVTASGVLADVLRIAQDLRGR